MHEKLANLVDVVTTLVDRLESQQVPYALGGAIALSAWSDPRATTNVDLTIWAQGDDLATALEVLREAGVVIDTATALHEAAERGLVVGRVDAYRVDVFTPSIPFYDEVLARRRRVRIADRDTWVLSAECLAVFKMLFFRRSERYPMGSRTIPRRLLDPTNRLASPDPPWRNRCHPGLECLRRAFRRVEQ